MYVYILVVIKEWFTIRMRHASAIGSAGTLPVKHNFYVVDLHAELTVKTVL